MIVTLKSGPEPPYLQYLPLKTPNGKPMIPLLKKFIANQSLKYCKLLLIFLPELHLYLLKLKSSRAEPLKLVGRGSKQIRQGYLYKCTNQANF